MTTCKSIILCTLLAATTLACTAAASDPTPDSAPFPIPDKTDAPCVIFDLKQKKQIGSEVGAQITLSEKLPWKGVGAVCAASGSWIASLPDGSGPRSGCAVSGAIGYGWYEPGTGVVYSFSSSAKCRTDGRWELVRGWH